MLLDVNTEALYSTVGFIATLDGALVRFDHVAFERAYGTVPLRCLWVAQRTFKTDRARLQGGRRRLGNSKILFFNFLSKDLPLIFLSFLRSVGYFDKIKEKIHYFKSTLQLR